MRRVTLVAVFLVALAAPAWADFQGGWEAYERGDYATALREWRPFAEQGNATAQSKLGAMYDNGLGVPQDFAESVKWYRLAAEQNNAVAQYNLGVMYANGRGVPQDDVLAHIWSSRAAAKLPPGEERDGAVNTRDSLAERMTPAQIADAQKLAREWKRKPE